MNEYELLKSRISGKVGEAVFYAGEVSTMVRNLGGSYTGSTVRRHLAQHRIAPNDLGVNASEFGIDDSVGLYPAAAVWQYLQSLEEKGKVKLQGNNVETLDDVVKRELHRKPFSAIDPTFGISKGRTVGPKIPIEAYGIGPSEEGAFKRQED